MTRKSGILARHRAVENAPSPDEAPDVGQVCPTYALMRKNAQGTRHSSDDRAGTDETIEKTISG
jgi:hypothetical protein